jgi:virulence-associated protein VagC
MMIEPQKIRLAVTPTHVQCFPGTTVSLSEDGTTLIVRPAEKPPSDAEILLRLDRVIRRAFNR